jgi:hypothetical protein
MASFKKVPAEDVDEMDTDSPEDDADGEVEILEAPPVRRSGRPPKKSEKVREVPVIHDRKGKGRKELKDKTSSKYLSFSPSKHAYWLVPVSFV